MEHRHRERQCWADNDRGVNTDNGDGGGNEDTTDGPKTVVFSSAYKDQEQRSGVTVFGKRMTSLSIVTMGEVLHILRPFVHSALRWNAGPRRWVAFFASVFFDLTSSCCVDAAAIIEVCQGRGFGAHGNPTVREAIA